MTKHNKDESASLEVLMKICKVLQYDIGDVLQKRHTNLKSFRIDMEIETYGSFWWR